VAVVVADVLVRMEQQLAELDRAGDPARFFLGTYLRTTRAVADALDDGTFEDPAWVAELDVAFAQLYLDALAAYRRDPESAPATWRRAFAADPSLPPEAHVLLGVHAHINVDLPQALIATMPPGDFTDHGICAKRRRDHGRIDRVLASRVAAEDDELARISGPPPLLDRLLRPFNQLGTQRFLREARAKVWANTVALNRARRQGPEPYAALLAQLEELSAAKVTELQAPGQVLLKLAATGFGVRLPAGA